MPKTKGGAGKTLLILRGVIIIIHGVYNVLNIDVPAKSNVRATSKLYSFI